MTADVELLPCGECGMPCLPGEYHPYAACLLFRACRNSDTVRGNLQDAQDHATAAQAAEIESLRAEVGRWRTEATEVANGAAVAIEQAEARAERRTEAINAYKSECDNPAKDYVLRAKRRDEMFDLLRDHDQENSNG